MMTNIDRIQLSAIATEKQNQNDDDGINTNCTNCNDYFMDRASFCALNAILCVNIQLCQPIYGYCCCSGHLILIMCRCQ